MRVGFIGTGNMGGAIARGIAASRVVKPEEIFLYDVMRKAAEELSSQIGAVVCDSAVEMVEQAEVVVLAVKPVYVEDALRACGDTLAGKAVVSIVAGLSTPALKQKLPAGTRYLQVMPNTPAMVGEGVTALCEENTLTKQERKFVEEIFSAIGKVLYVPGRLIEAVSAVSGSGPAYAAMFIEALADSGVLMGLPRKTAEELAAQTLLGTAKMAMESGKHPGALKDMVCSPGGTTIRAVRALEKGGFRASIIDAACAAYEKSLEMKREAEKDL